MNAVHNIHTHLNLNGNEVRNVRLEGLPSDPDPVEGGVYFNLETGEFRFSDGTAWKSLLGGFWKLDDDGNLVTDKTVIVPNLIVRGDLSTEAKGTDSGAAGGIIGVKVGDAEYTDITAGLLDMTDAFEGLDVYVDLSDYYTNEEADAKIAEILIPYAKITDVGSTYATKASLETLQGEVDNIEAILGMDEEAAGIINTWNEVKAFLDGYSSSDDLAAILSTMNADIAKRALDSDLDALALTVDDNTTNIRNLKDSVYTKDDLATYKSWWDDLMGLIIKEGNDIKIKTNLIVAGDTSSEGTGESVVSGITGIKLNGETYKDENNDGIIDLGTITGGLTSVSWSDVQGRPTRVSEFLNDSGYITGIDKSMVASAIGASGNAGKVLSSTGGDLGWISLPTSLPASDVYAWAKKSSLALADVPDLSSKYLSVNGGTMEGTVTFSASAPAIKFYRASGTPYIRFGASSSKEYGELGVNSSGNLVFWSLVEGNTAYNAWNTLIHSGNIGSQSVQSAKDALRFKGLASSGDLNTVLAGGGMARTYSSGLSTDFTNAPSGASFGTVLQLSAAGFVGLDTLSGQLAWDVNHNSTTDATRYLWWRAADTNGFTNSKWHQVAFTDSNVASATKLATARTIWGQSFDGTADIEGSIDKCNWIRYYTGSANSGYIVGRGEEITGGNGLGLWTYGNTPIFFGTSSATRMLINSSGNVTIGASDLAGTTYKMSVDGKVHIRSTAGAGMTEGAGSLIVGNGTVLMIDANDIQAKTNGTTAGPLYINDWGGNVILCGKNNGNVLIGTSTDSGHKLDVNGAIRSNSIVINRKKDNVPAYYISEGATEVLEIRTAGGSVPIVFNTNYNGAGERMRIAGNGNIGMGTDNPSAKLHVLSNTNESVNILRLQNSAYGGSGAEREINILMGGSVDFRAGIIKAIVNDAYGFFQRFEFVEAGSYNKVLMTIANTGAVTMSSTLSVTSGVTSTRFLTNGNCGIWRGSSYTTAMTANDIAFYADYFRFECGSQFVKTLEIDERLVTVTGNLVVSGDIGTGSDIRFKDRIADHRIALESIAQAPLFTFKWNDREDKTEHLGTSAQYWEGVAPWLVKGTDFKVLDYSTLGVAIGISLANKTLNHEERILNHEERIKILEKENEQLKEQLRRINYGN